MLLASCGSDDNDTQKETVSPSETPVVTTAPPETETSAEITIPYVPGETIYSDTNHIGIQSPNGELFIDGRPINSEAFDAIIEYYSSTLPYTTPEIATANKETAVTTGKTPSAPSEAVTSSSASVPSSTQGNPAVTNVVTSPVTTTTVTAPDLSFPEINETERPTGQINLEEADQNLGKYVKSSNTDLKITKVQVYNNSKPGVTNIESFRAGETMLVNLWCDTTAFFDATLYIVPEETEHKSSYKKSECLVVKELYTAMVTDTTHLFLEVKIPSYTPARVYELRFVCGSEEGYIPFHIG